jgi:hypothetical protein
MLEEKCRCARHAALFSALVATSPIGVDVLIQVSVSIGIADIIVNFPVAESTHGS